VQDQLASVYSELRNREGNRLFSASYEEMMQQFNSEKITAERKHILAEKLKELRKMYPLNILDVKTITNPSI
jgi:hypothetical protein